MNYRKVIESGHIIGIGETTASGNISQTEYDELEDVFRNKPDAPDGYVYLLKTDLTWELVERYHDEPEPEPDAEELLSILTGGDAE